MPAELNNGAPIGSVVTCNDSGWMDADTFTKWLQHLVDFVKPTAYKKVLLVLDGHSTHVKNLKAIELARKENAIGLYRENAIAIESEARDPFGSNVYYVTMQITFPIPEFARKERNLHCDLVHVTTKNSPVHCADNRRAHSSVTCAHSRSTNSPVRRADSRSFI